MKDKMILVGRNVLVEVSQDVPGLIKQSLSVLFSGRVLATTDAGDLLQDDEIYFTKAMLIPGETTEVIVSLDSVVLRKPRPVPAPSFEDIAYHNKTAAEAKKCAEYKPDEPRKTVLDDGRIAYEAMSNGLVLSDETVSVQFGVKTMDCENYTGFPGVPETRGWWFCVDKSFKPEVVEINSQFALVGFFSGQMNNLRIVPGSVIPASALVDKTQPDYNKVDRGLSMTLTAKNISSELCAFTGRIIGRELSEQ